jgi:two-component system response regulator YesN
VKKYRKEFVAIVNDGDMEEAKLLLSEIKEEAKGQKYKPKSIRIVFSNLINELFEHFKGALVEDSQLKRHETYHEEMMQSKTLDELIQRYTKFLIVLMNVVNKSNIGHSKLLIQRVLDYIEEHYVEGVSLENVASYMNLSKHYLSTLFKKETGENMTTYINRKKIERAKVLLMNPEYRIQDVVEKVGFSNQQYFSKMFKRITGMTVMEYKEKRRDK